MCVCVCVVLYVRPNTSPRTATFGMPVTKRVNSVTGGLIRLSVVVDKKARVVLTADSIATVVYSVLCAERHLPSYSRTVVTE